MMSIEPEQSIIANESLSVESALDGTHDMAEHSTGPQVAVRLVDYADGRKIALSPHTTYGLIEHPTYEEVPGAAHYGYGLMTWQSMRLPLLNLYALLHADCNAVRITFPRYALIVAYQRAVNEPIEYGAIGLAALPQTIHIGDEAQCELPCDSSLWPLLALSCFQYEDKAVPILDTERIFAAYHS
jgi:hypothetical protein